MQLNGAPNVIDDLQGRLPPSLKWCFAGAGAMAGLHYAHAAAGRLLASYLVSGAALGFCLLGGLFASLRLLKTAAVLVVLLLVVNYALLIPFGYGDHFATWLRLGQAGIGYAIAAGAHLLDRWRAGLS